MYITHSLCCSCILALTMCSEQVNVTDNKTNSLLHQKHNSIIQLLVFCYGNMFQSFFRPSSFKRSLELQSVRTMYYDITYYLKGV
jgi:hypothetical protein